jgi:hypothetical protein
MFSEATCHIKQEGSEILIKGLSHMFLEVCVVHQRRIALQLPSVCPNTARLHALTWVAHV